MTRRAAWLEAREAILIAHERGQLTCEDATARLAEIDPPPDPFAHLTLDEERALRPFLELSGDSHA